MLNLNALTLDQRRAVLEELPFFSPSQKAEGSVLSPPSTLAPDGEPLSDPPKRKPGRPPKVKP